MLQYCANTSGDQHSASQSVVSTDQLHDLTLKYQVLEQKYKTLHLQSDEYQKYISELQHQNEDLKQELAHYQQEATNEQSLKPLVNHHMKSMRTSLFCHEKKITKLQHTHSKLEVLAETLQSENIKLKKQNQRLENALGNRDKQQQMSKQISKTNTKLQSENLLLRDELHIIKTIKMNQNCAVMSDMNSFKLRSPSAKSEKRAIRLNFTKTPTINDHSLSLGKCYNNGHSRCRSSLSQHTASEHRHFLSTSSQWGFPNHINSDSLLSVACDGCDGMRRKLDGFEMQNQELLAKIEKLESELNESEDLEQLFQKCDKEVKAKRKETGVTKHQRWYSKYGSNRNLFGL